MSDLPRPTVCRGVGQSRLQSQAVQHGPSSGISATIFAQHTQKRRIWGVLSALGELFRAYTTTLKPTTPPLTPNKGPLKPPSPLRPKNAPKTPISHPQRRWQFQSHTDTSKQRRRWFQTTGPPRLQHPHAAPAGGGEAWPDNKPTCPAIRQHTSPHWRGGHRNTSGATNSRHGHDKVGRNPSRFRPTLDAQWRSAAHGARQ